MRFHLRRLLHFRVRTVLVLMTIIAAWLGWWLYVAWRQRQAVAEIRKVGAAVVYDFQRERLKSPHPPPGWLVDLFGVDFCADVADVHCGPSVNEGDHYKRVTDATLAHIGVLREVRCLDLASTRITDAGLRHLDGLASLELLYLSDTQVTDDGVKRLQQALPDCRIYVD